MANFTQNYGLHQWEPTDPFLREDFNQDFSTIDAALGEVAAQSVQVPDLSYNVYNLMLQNYYDGKQTGYKKAMLFDGFLDESGVAEKASQILHNGKSALVLHRTGQSDKSFGYAANESQGTLIRSYTATGGGRWTGLTYRIYNNVQYSDPVEVTYTIQIDGQTVATGTDKCPAPGVGSYTTRKLTFSTTYDICAGMVCTVTLQTGTDFFTPAYGSDGAELGGIFHFTSVAASTGQLLTVPYDLPACDGLRLWGRYQGGSVALAVEGTDGQQALEQVNLRQTVNLQGEGCSEAEFVLDKPLEAGARAFRLTLNTGSDAYISLSDYGGILL